MSLQLKDLQVGDMLHLQSTREFYLIIEVTSNSYKEVNMKTKEILNHVNVLEDSIAPSATILGNSKVAKVLYGKT